MCGQCCIGYVSLNAWTGGVCMSLMPLTCSTPMALQWLIYHRPTHDKVRDMMSFRWFSYVLAGLPHATFNARHLEPRRVLLQTQEACEPVTMRHIISPTCQSAWSMNTGIVLFTGTSLRSTMHFVLLQGLQYLARSISTSLPPLPIRQ